jgi:hypothetical protein
MAAPHRRFDFSRSVHGLKQTQLGKMSAMKIILTGTTGFVVSEVLYHSQIDLNRVKPREAVFDNGTALRRIQIDLEAKRRAVAGIPPAQASRRCSGSSALANNVARSRFLARHYDRDRSRLNRGRFLLEGLKWRILAELTD